MRLWAEYLCQGASVVCTSYSCSTPGSCSQVSFAAAPSGCQRLEGQGGPFLLQRGSKSKPPFMSCWDCHGHAQNVVRALVVARSQEWSKAESLAQRWHFIFLIKSYFFFLSFGIYLLHIVWALAKSAIFMLNIKNHFLNIHFGLVKEKVSNNYFFCSHWIRKQKYMVYLSKI